MNFADSRWEQARFFYNIISFTKYSSNEERSRKNLPIFQSYIKLYI